MTKWTDEEKALMVKHYDYFAAKGKTWMFQEDFLPDRTIAQISACARKMKENGEWETLHKQLHL